MVSFVLKTYVESIPNYFEFFRQSLHIWNLYHYCWHIVTIFLFSVLRFLIGH